MIHVSRIIRPYGSALLLVVALTLSMTTAQAIIIIPKIHAIWVFPDPSIANPITNQTARLTLINNSATSGVNVIYLSVYSPNPNLAGRYMYDDGALADLITQAHAKGIQVHAAYGAPDWPTLGCDSNSFPLQRMAEIASYNASYPTSKFDGIVLDIEPPEPQSTTQFQALLSQYQCIRQSLPADMRLSVAIRFFWDAQVEFPVGSGIVKKVYEHVIDMDMKNVVVMGYRDFAGPADCSKDGLVCLDQDEIAYAKNSGKSELILVGLETSDPSSTGISNKETFFEEGQSVLDDVAQVVFDHFGYFNGFGGFAVHNYQNSYMGGLSLKWPTSNSGLPKGIHDAQEVFTQPGANVDVAVGPIGSANISVGFPDITIPGYTYASLIDPNSAGALPSGYQITDYLALEITTTAAFTGPATVCFNNLGIDPGMFSTLRVLHNAGTGFVDETILSGPNAPNPITQTICASVTSFSPFVLANLFDTTPPTVVAPAPTSAPTDINCQAAIPNILLRTSASDNSGSVTLQQSPTAGTLVGTGPHTITVTATDPSGNSSTATTTFTVADNTPPTITAPPNVVATTGAGATSCGVVISNATLGAATASDNCSSVTPIRSGVPAGNNFLVGTTTVSYTATDGSGNTTTVTQTVTVTDNTPPVITCPSSITVETCDAIGAVVSFPTPTASDNCGVASVTASPASGSTFPIGLTTVTATAIDAAGNRSTCSFTVTVVGARGTKQNVLDELKALRATVTNKDDREKLDLAILRLATSLNAQYWIDQTHVKPQYGDKVFDAEQDAVAKLRDLIKHNAAEEGDKHDGHGEGDDSNDRDDRNDRKDRDHRVSSIPEAILRGFISRIVCADRILAQVAINDGVNHGANAKDIAKATTKLANGDHDALKKKYEGAIEDYQEAWRVFNRKDD